MSEAIVPTIIEDTSEIDAALEVAEPMQGNLGIESISLPGFDDFGVGETEEKKVVKSIRDIFKGFDFNSNDDFASRFPTLEALSTYAANALEDIKSARTRSTANELLTKAACIGRFWCVGKTLNGALTNAQYGTAAYNQLATALGCSTGYIYKWRAVSQNLSLSQAYLMGVRGVDQTTLVNLAYTIKDDGIRNALVESFVGSVVDGADEPSRLEALKKLKQAINDIQHNNALEATNTDPATGGNMVEVTQEYADLMKLFKELHRKYAPVAEEKLFENVASVCEQFYIMDDVPDAADYLENVKEQAEELKTLITAAVNYGNEAMAQLDSILNSTITQSEEDAADDKAGTVD